MLAERAREIDVIKEVAKKEMLSAAARGGQVAFGTARGLSQRWACRLLSDARSSLAYVSRLKKRDAPVLEAVRELARQYPRYGYRLIQVFFARREQ